MKFISFASVFSCLLSFTLASLPKLPNKGNAIVRTSSKCETPKIKIGCDVHFSANLNNLRNCPIGSKAWPLMFPWEVKYQMADGKRLPEPNPKNLTNPVPPDGYVRSVYTINGKTPGPTIYAIKGDWVLIPVTNNIKKSIEGGKIQPELLTIHWHGITMRAKERQTPPNDSEPLGTPFMDGVPGINQCPTPGFNDTQNNRFDYFFQFVDSGTFWYHSHYEGQHGDGLVGSMIVKDCKDAKRFGYEEDDDWNNINIVNVQDWYHDTTDEILVKYMNASDIPPEATQSSGYAFPSEFLPDTGLIGGTIFSNTSEINRPYKIYNFTQNNTYRLRLINMSLMSMFLFSIDDHEFEVIEVDGMLVQPQLFKRIPINTAQRYSIRVKANQSISNYWMRFDYLGDCYRDGFPPEESPKAIVRYNDADEIDPETEPHDEDILKCTDLNVTALTPLCDKTLDYVLFCDYKPPSVIDYDFTMNIIMDAWKEPRQYDKDDEWEQYFFGYIADRAHGEAPYAEHHYSNVLDNTLLDVLKVKNNGNKPWNATNNAYNLVKRGATVDILFKSADTMEHPIHLHGHFFYVLGWGDETTKNMINESSLNL
ncbi:18523_t:CDS:2, partial [Funneliformis geosporum]